jgi:hypothetical protein
MLPSSCLCYVPYTFLFNNGVCGLEMAAFYVKGKVDLMILVDILGNVRVTKKCILYMFGFQPSSIHVSRNDVYDDNNVVKFSIY